MKILVLDDMKHRLECFYAWYGHHEGYRESKTAEKAVRILSIFSPFDVVFLDHDLNDKHYDGIDDGETGYAVCQHIVELPEQLRPRLVVVHSMSPSGSERMMELLNDKGINAKRIMFPTSPSRNAPLMQISKE